MSGSICIGWRKEGICTHVNGSTALMDKICDPRVLSEQKEAWLEFRALITNLTKSEGPPQYGDYGALFVDFDEKKVFCSSGYANPMMLDLVELALLMDRAKNKIFAFEMERFFNPEKRLKAAFDLGWAGDTSFIGGVLGERWVSKENGGARSFEEGLEMARKTRGIKNQIVALVKDLLKIDESLPSRLKLTHPDWEISISPQTSEGIVRMIHALTLNGILKTPEDVHESWTFNYLDELAGEPEAVSELGTPKDACSAALAMKEAEILNLDTKESKPGRKNRL